MHCQPVWRQGEVCLHCLTWFAWSLNVSQVTLWVVVSQRNTHDVFLTREPLKYKFSSISLGSVLCPSSSSGQFVLISRQELKAWKGFTMVALHPYSSQFQETWVGHLFFCVITCCLLLGLNDFPSHICNGKIKSWGVPVRQGVFCLHRAQEQ